jgi:hypothetical protein
MGGGVCGSTRAPRGWRARARWRTRPCGSGARSSPGRERGHLHASEGSPEGDAHEAVVSRLEPLLRDGGRRRPPRPRRTSLGGRRRPRPRSPCSLQQREPLSTDGSAIARRTSSLDPTPSAAWSPCPHAPPARLQFSPCRPSFLNSPTARRLPRPYARFRCAPSDAPPRIRSPGIRAPAPERTTIERRPSSGRFAPASAPQRRLSAEPSSIILQRSRIILRPSRVIPRPSRIILLPGNMPSSCP